MVGVDHFCTHAKTKDLVRGSVSVIVITDSFYGKKSLRNLLHISLSLRNKIVDPKLIKKLVKIIVNKLMSRPRKRFR